VTPGHPLMEAVENAMRLRGERNTGWAMAWKLCLWARAGWAEKAYDCLKMALNHAQIYSVSTNPQYAGVYYNLLDAHPPFQIDGNLGVCAGIAEMLLQSHGDTLQLLPALPEAWKAGGRVTGLRAEGNRTVDFGWKDGRVTSLTVNGEAVPDNSIRDMQASDSTSVTIVPAAYDLRGRRLSAQPQRGLYIRNGKKYVKN